MKANPQWENIPIIFITALDTEDDIVKGLNIGADDYIAKPLSIKEVKARVAAVLRRNKNVAHVQEDKVRYEGLIIDQSAKTASLNGTPLQLTKLEFELLLLFLMNPQKVFTREELLDRCWPHDICVIDRTVDVNITRLRKKIGEYGKQIKTRVGYGYYFEN